MIVFSYYLLLFRIIATKRPRFVFVVRLANSAATTTTSCCAHDRMWRRNHENRNGSSEKRRRVTIAVRTCACNERTNIGGKSHERRSISRSPFGEHGRRSTSSPRYRNGGRYYRRARRFTIRSCTRVLHRFSEKTSP